MSKTAVSEDNLTHLESAIANVVKTLQRNASRTLEMKQRTAKVLADAAAYHTGSVGRSYRCKTGNSRRLTTSLTFQTSSFPCLPNLKCSQETQSVQGTMERQKKTVNSIRSGSGMESGKNTVNSTKLKSIVFKTLDRILKIPKGPAPPQPPKTVNHTAPETKVERFPEPNMGGLLGYLPMSVFQGSSTTLDDLESQDENLLPELDSCSGVVSIASSEESSNGDSWVYVNNPIHVQEVIMDDSLNYSHSKRGSNINNLNNCRNMGVEAQVPPKKPPRYIKRSSKNGGNKIKRKLSERQQEAESNAQRVAEKTLAIAAYNQKAEKKIRPDSPIDSGNKRKMTPPTTSSSLPNLMELSFGEYSDSLPDFNTNSFSKGIALRPSSTLLKSAPNVFVPDSSSSSSGIQRIDDEEDASSTCTASSFSSMHIPEEEIASQATQQRRSALCQDVYVMPIQVPVLPLRDLRNIRGISDEEFRKLSEAFVPSEDGLIHNITVRNCSISICSSTLNSSVPPPPPLPGVPPPPPMPIQMTFGTVSRPRLPLAVFTQPRKGNTIFNQMERIEIGENDAKKLKEKFPLLNKKNGELKVKQSPNSDTLKFQLNIELFLKKWGIVGPKVEILLDSISTLNAKPDLIDMTCITTLPIPKKKEIEKIAEAKIHRELGQAEIFLLKLSKISNLETKLSCIRFSLDFEESTQAVFRRIDTFSSTCHAVSTSKKFIKIIEVVMALMNSLNTDEGSQLYGFDIQSLSKLAMKTSEDGTTTLLHWLIEYILDNPVFKDSVDFYLDFNDLSTVSKTSLKDITEKCNEWKKSLNQYEQELNRMSKDRHDQEWRFTFPMRFQRTAETILADLTNRINAAQQAFQSCKENYGLSNTEITETGFFDSISRFITSYRTVYMEVVEKSRRVKAKRRNSFAPISSSVTPMKKAVHPNRKPCDFKGLSALKPISNIPGNNNGCSNELEQCLFDMFTSDKNQGRVPNRRKSGIHARCHLAEENES